MVDDIEAFLRHAAQRRAARKHPARPRQLGPVGQQESVVEAETVPAHVPPPIRTRSGTGKRQRAAQSTSRPQPSQADQRPRSSNRTLELADIAEVSPNKLKNEMAQLLRNPKSLRQAIVLSEILRRPVHRR